VRPLRGLPSPAVSRIFTGPQNEKFKDSKYVSTKNRNIRGHAKI